MENLHGWRDGTHVLVHSEHMYVVSSKVKNTTLKYYRCLFKDRCSARMSVKNLNDETLKVPTHSHEPNLQKLQELRFVNELVKEAATSNEDPRNLYDRVSQAYPIGCLNYPFETARMKIGRQRRKTHPRVPRSHEDINVLLSDPQWEGFGKDLKGGPFYRETIQVQDGSVCVVFVSERLKDLMTQAAWNAHCDSTFASTPAQPRFSQLFTLHAVDQETFGQKKQIYPTAYALMTSKTASAYEAVLKCIISHVQGFVPPSSLMCDFELAFRSVFTSMWPTIRISGCWFHFSQAIYRRAVNYYHLRQDIRDNPDARTLIKMVMAIPLLDAHLMDEGLQTIKDFALERNLSRYDGLLSYTESFWFDVVGRQVLQVGDLESRTNNAVEGFYSQLNKKLSSKRHPNFWVFVKTLKSMDSAACTTRNSIRNFRSPRRRRPVSIRQDLHIQEGRERYLLQPETPDVAGFLRHSSYSIDSLVNTLTLSLEELAAEQAAVPPVVSGRPSTSRPPTASGSSAARPRSIHQLSTILSRNSESDPDDPDSDPGESTTTGFVLPGNVVIRKLTERGRKRPHPELQQLPESSSEDNVEIPPPQIESNRPSTPLDTSYTLEAEEESQHMSSGRIYRRLLKLTLPSVFPPPLRFDRDAEEDDMIDESMMPDQGGPVLDVPPPPALDLPQFSEESGVPQKWEITPQTENSLTEIQKIVHVYKLAKFSIDIDKVYSPGYKDYKCLLCRVSGVTRTALPCTHKLFCECCTFAFATKTFVYKGKICCKTCPECKSIVSKFV